MPGVRPRALALTAATAALLTAACSSSSTPAAAPVTPAPPPTTVSPAPTPSPEPAEPAASFLTGRPDDKNGRVLVVKVDNSPAGRPHTGISAADVVYLEPVEAGVTRLAAVFSSRLPPTVGPVRSARITDLGLFAQYGKVAFAYSGAQKKLEPAIARADLFEVHAEKGATRSGPGYSRSAQRTAPLNLYGSPHDLLDRAPHAQKAHDIGFRFGPAVPGGRPATSASTSFTAARVAFTWSAERERWRWVMDGKPAVESDGSPIEASTVVFQHVSTKRSEYSDFTGANTPYAKTTGSGRAVVLRDGEAQQVRWSRAKASAPTVFTKGSDRVTFARGTTWVVLVAKKGKVTVS